MVVMVVMVFALFSLSPFLGVFNASTSFVAFKTGSGEKTKINNECVF